MDKPSPDMHRSPLRKGFALFVTLSVLAVMISLAGVLVSYLDIARKDATQTEAVIQANIYFSDTKDILTKFKDKKALYSILYTTPLPLQLEDSEFALILTCRPLNNGVNINWLQYESSNNPLKQTRYNTAQKVFDAVAQKYEIEDPALLEEMILSKHALTRLTQKNDIMSYRQFIQLLSDYQFEADDRKIGEIPWEKYFVFTPPSKSPESDMIEGDYLSADLLSILFDIDIQTLNEEWSEGEGAFKTLMKKYGIEYDKKLYAEAFINRSRCDVSYIFNKKQFRFAFSDEEGEVKDFEFYGEE